MTETDELPTDYEACGECGYDHAYEYAEAHAFHTRCELAAVKVADETR